MKSLIVFVVVIASALGNSVDLTKNGLAAALAKQGGMIPMGNGRIVNGTATTVEEFSWIISIQYYGSHRCGGSIITTTRILTAAHCVITISPGLLSVRAGSTSCESDGQLVSVSHITNHPSYNKVTLENDISVMGLLSSLNTSPAGVSIIALPIQGAEVSTGIVAHVAGWGALCEKCVGSTTLRYVAVPVISNVECNSMYGGGITAGMLCAGFSEGGQDACQGDSGGPLSLNNTNLLIGVVSWGDGCARPNSPGVYTRVSFYRNWINGLL